MIDQNSEIDALDRKIMDALVIDGRMSVTALADRIGLSKTPTQLRLKRLVDLGYIEGVRAVLNKARLGLDHVAFVEVKLSDTREDALTAFNDAVKRLKEVEACHMVASRFDYLLKVRSTSITAYRRILGESISKLPFVSSTSTFVVMEAVKE